MEDQEKNKMNTLKLLSLAGMLLCIASCSPQTQGEATAQAPEPISSGYAEAAEGLHVYYEIYGEDEPIVILAGGVSEPG